MFSQLRQAVENFAPQPIRGSDSTSVDEPRGSASRSNSLDLTNGARPTSPLSSGQLADSALQNLRKTLGTQRSGGVSPVPRSTRPASPSGSKSPKFSLEDRLRRATFAIVDQPNATSPAPSGRSSPSPMPKSVVSQHPLSPSQTPLPDSPTITPQKEIPADAHKAQTSPPPPKPDTAELTQTAEFFQEANQPSAEPSQILPDVATLEPQRELSSSLESSVQGNDLPIEHLEEAKEIVDDHKDITNGDENGLPQKTEKSVSVDEAASTLENHTSASSVEVLQERLKEIEQRLADVSASFKKLQAEKLVADSILQEWTPVMSIGDDATLRDHFQSLESKSEISQDEIRQLNGKLKMQEERLNELRDTHKLESASQSEELEKLRAQLDEKDKIIHTLQALNSQAEVSVAKTKGEADHVRTELERVQTLAKEEEEKRTKAISLLKTVRQKLVKVEKEKEDLTKEVTSLRTKDKGDKDKEQHERTRLQLEIDQISSEREKEKVHMKTQFEGEIAALKERYEKEYSALRGQLELEAVTTKSLHTKEISTKDSQIATLEKSLNTVNNNKNAFFDQLQQRQAELESVKSRMESLENQNIELQFQLRESNDRLAVLKEEYLDLQRENESQSREQVTSVGDVAHLVSATEERLESKISELKRNLALVEKERSEAELEWSRKLNIKTKEAEDFKKMLGSAAKTTETDEKLKADLKAEIETTHEEVRLLRQQLSEFPKYHQRIADLEALAKSQEEELSTKISAFKQQILEGKSREAQLKQNNKLIREELRKVQSSAALLERQRNPGVGYWTSRTTENNVSASRTSISSITSDTPSRTGTSETGSGAPEKSNKEEEINLEYLRNVILQFLEHKEMRPNLVQVLSIILHFTPQETRRLIAKV